VGLVEEGGLGGFPSDGVFGCGEFAGGGAEVDSSTGVVSSPGGEEGVGVEVVGVVGVVDVSVTPGAGCPGADVEGGGGGGAAGVVVVGGGDVVVGGGVVTVGGGSVTVGGGSVVVGGGVVGAQ
jgi:hypothetical protein